MRYKVPFVDAPAQYQSLKPQVLEAIDRTLSAGNLILRQETEDFERHFAEYIGCKYAVGVGSGFDAVHLALRAVGFESGDEVITVSHTCIATVSAIANAGARPVLVDVGNDCNMDMSLVEEAITPRTKAILPVHLDGQPCDMERLMEIADKHGLTVIEDVAQALGARFDDRPLGSFGLLGAFSLYPFKMLGALGDAGIITTSDADLANRLRALRGYGRDRESGDYVCWGFDSKLDNIYAAILDVKLKHLPHWIERRRHIAAKYYEGLSDVPGLDLPPDRGERFFGVYLNYIVRTERRDGLRRYLADRGVETLISLSRPIHTHPALGLTAYHLPVTEAIARTYLCLTTSPETDDDQVRYVIQTVRQFFEP